jgi:hypothetical protein
MSHPKRFFSLGGIAGAMLYGSIGIFSIGCGSDESGPAGEQPDDVMKPDDAIGKDPDPPPPGPGVIELQFAEGEANPGEEVNFCEWLDPLEEDIYVSRLDTYQDRGGHHLIFYRWNGEPKAPGTIEDCADGRAMAQMMLVATPIVAPENEAAYVEFEAGSALLIEAGTQMIAQYHYINTGDTVMKFQDVAHFTTVPKADVQRVILTFGMGSIDYSLPPGMVTTEAFECDVPFDMEPVLAFPHMHEHGVKFLADVGTAGERRTVIDVGEWEPGMRDVPPITNYLETSAVFHKGEKIRTFCTWENDESEPLTFPYEMCATAGYFSSDDPAATNILCAGSDKIPTTP